MPIVFIPLKKEKYHFFGILIITRMIHFHSFSKRSFSMIKIFKFLLGDTRVTSKILYYGKLSDKNKKKLILSTMSDRHKPGFSEGRLFYRINAFTIKKTLSEEIIDIVIRAVS